MPYRVLHLPLKSVTFSLQQCHSLHTGASQDDPEHAQFPTSHIFVWQQQLVLIELCVLINTEQYCVVSGAVSEDHQGGVQHSSPHL